MFRGEVELGESRSPARSLENDVFCNIGVAAGRREHVQDVPVVGGLREFSTCCQYARKYNDTCKDRIVIRPLKCFARMKMAEKTTKVVPKENENSLLTSGHPT